MFEHITFENILKKMLDSIPNNIDKREGSIIYNALAPAAVEIQNIYIELDWILDQSFPDTANREYLIRRCRERGIFPKKATKAILKGKFNIDVKIGSRFSLDDLNYKVVEKITYRVFKLECEKEGEIGNKKLGELIPIEYIENLTKCELVEILIPGEEEENTESLRKRYFDTFNCKAYGGNIRDYTEKTNSIAGVGATKITPVFNGGGTVLVTILDSNFNKATETLIEKVQNILDPKKNTGKGYGVAPIGHKVTVNTPKEKNINIKSKIILNVDYIWDQLKKDITEVIENYFKEIRKNWAESNINVVRISQIDTRILSIKGVIDILDTKINDKKENLILDTYEIPKLENIEKL